MNKILAVFISQRDVHESLKHCKISKVFISQRDVHESLKHCKISKVSDARKLCCNQPKFQMKRPKHRVIYSKGAV